MNNKVVNDIKLDALIAVAAEEALLHALDQIPEPDELDKIYTPSPQSGKRVKRLMQSRKRAEMMRKAARAAKWAAAVFAVIFAVGTITLFSVEESRNYILDTAMAWYDDHIRFELAGAVPVKVGQYILTHVPDGYALENSYGTGVRYQEVYTDGAEGVIVFQQGPAQHSQISVDNEKVEYTVVRIGDITVHSFVAIEEGGYSLVLWAQDRFIFELSAPLDMEEILQMVESVQRKEISEP